MAGGLGASQARLPPVWRGALFMLAATSCAAVDTVIVRLVVQGLDPILIAFFRNLFSLVFMLPWIVAQRRAAIATRRLPMHAFRALLKLLALSCFYWAVARLPLAEVTAITFSTPLFVALGAVLLLGERLPRARALAMLAGFLGVLIVLRPGGPGFGPGTIAALLAALGLAGVALSVKSLSRTDPPDTIVVLNLLLSAPLGLLLALPVWRTPGLALLGWLVVQGVLGAVAQLAVTRAMRLADASTIVPIDFLRLPIVGLLAFLAFGEVADLWTWLGGAVIVAATIQGIRGGGRLSGVAGGRGGR
ncbi:MAG TPA: DMT family transporter [Geminicoccaceae bacterium]|nr:DMT family transporter [Geminicoccaceae bacterium]